MYYFCTYFDVNYMPRALSMYNSLQEHCKGFHIYMLCFDDESFSHLTTLCLPHATPISLAEFESGDDELIATKQDRTQLEYFYTCGPSLPLFILNNYPQVDFVIYVDADLFFYSDPKPLIDEMDGYSIGITAHHFPEHRKSEQTGIYNVGWLFFRRDANGLACLQWWRERCIEWCYERFEDGKYADQKYLDEWPSRFQGVRVLEHRGANVAAWNVRDYTIREEDGCVVVDGYPLIFYHFHGFRQINRWVYNTNLGLTFRFPTKVLMQRIFKPYISELKRSANGRKLTRSIRKKRLRSQWIQLTRTLIRTIIGIMFRQYIVVIDDKVY